MDGESLHLLLAGPLPPPVGGITGFVELLKRHGTPVCASLDVFDTSAHRDVASAGTWSAQNALRAFTLTPRFAARVREPRLSVVQIEAGGYLGLLKSAVLASVAHPLPYVVSVHSADLRGDFELAARFGRAVVRRAIRRAAAVRVMYAQQADVLCECVPGVSRARIHVIRPFIPPAPRDEVRPQMNGVVQIVSVGAVGRRKGTFDLLDVAAFLRDHRVPFRWDLLGSEERAGEFAEIQAKHARLRLHGFVHLHGSVPWKTVDEYLAKADVFVLLSKAEGLPLALMEAMARGVPVVTTNVGAIGETVSQPIPTFFPDDGEGARDALLRLVRDPTLREACGEANAARVRTYLSPDAVMPLFVRMWEQAARR